MNNSLRDRSTAGKIIVLEGQPSAEAVLPPWMFRHDDLIKTLSSAGSIDKKKLINTLNYLHFKGESLYVLLKHPQYGEDILVKAHPEPCLDDEFTCHWDPTYGGYNLERYLFQHLIISHQQAVIVVPAELLTAGTTGLTLKLPETSHVISERQSPRFACQDVKAELWQNGFQAEGELLDFSPQAFRIRVQPAPPSSFHWFNADVPAIIRLSNSRDVFFSGNCQCIQQKQNGRSRELVLAPNQDQIRRFPAKVQRNPRLQSSPPFNATFEHPFFKKKIQREIHDISTSGFSFFDKSDEVVLMPGMIIPEINIVYAGIIRIICKAQVIYCKEENDHIRFGVATLDMDLTNYNNLNQVLNNIQGGDTATFNEVDLDELWEFFFDTNFIYPQKYKSIQSFKDDFQETYRKLYEDAPEIAKHFTYQSNGRIYGHISILRTYERTWMVHHLAARPKGGRPIGLVVMKLLISYLNDLRRLPSANMDHIMLYFRPTNKFMEKFFGGFAKELANPQQCSLDLFTYITYPRQARPEQLPKAWSLKECSSADFWEFEQFYRNSSHGLFWAIIDPENQPHAKSLEEVCAKIGFTRRWQTFALTYNGDLKAFIVADESDVGINLSDLLNGFKVFVMDPGLPQDVLFAAVSELAKDYATESVPVLIYPADYTQQEDMVYEKKQYLLWILDVQYVNDYLAYVEKKFRIKFVQ